VRDPERDLDRRKFLSGVGGGALLAAAPGLSQAGGHAAAPPAREIDVAGAAPTEANRIEAAYRVRLHAAELMRRRVEAPHRTNRDLERFADGAASFSKGLPHDSDGIVDGEAWARLRRGLDMGSYQELESVPLGGSVRLADPLAAHAMTPEGCDGCQVDLQPPPAIDSQARAGEAIELYWMALLRDVPFAEWEADPRVQLAAAEVSALGVAPTSRAGEPVTAQTLFRGSSPGDQVGPYVSQFLLKEVAFGPIQVFPKVRTFLTGYDHMTRFDEWLAVQNGAAPRAPQLATHRYVRSLRDLAAYVHTDFSYQAFVGAALVLFGMEGTTDARQPYRGARYDSGNPYREASRQQGFVTFGQAYVLDLVARVARAALAACWYQKWLVHLDLRPEEFGGRVELARRGRARVPIHEGLFGSRAVQEIVDRTGGALLSQAYPSGAPIHPSFPSGHATIAGACATALKALFDEEFPVEEPVVAAADGLSLYPYRGGALTIGGELDKLASNVAFGRNAAGIHWRSDGIEGLKLGEAVALSVLAAERSYRGGMGVSLSVRCFGGEVVEV